MNNLDFPTLFNLLKNNYKFKIKNYELFELVFCCKDKNLYYENYRISKFLNYYERIPKNLIDEFNKYSNELIFNLNTTLENNINYADFVINLTKFNIILDFKDNDFNYYWIIKESLIVPYNLKTFKGRHKKRNLNLYYGKQKLVMNDSEYEINFLS